MNTIEVLYRERQQPKFWEFFEDWVPDSSKILIALEENSDLENYLDRDEPELLQMKRRKSR